MNKTCFREKAKVNSSEGNGESERKGQERQNVGRAIAGKGLERERRNPDFPPPIQSCLEQVLHWALEQTNLT